MSDFLTINPLTGGDIGTAPNFLSASTNDALSVVMAAGYVEDLVNSHILKKNDILYINYDVDGTPGFGSFRVMSDGTLIQQGFDSIQDNIAAAGNIQPAATLLYGSICNVTSGSAGTQDGVMLPVSNPSAKVLICNNSGISINVVPQEGDILNDLATNTAITVLNGSNLLCMCPKVGRWACILTYVTP